MPRQKKPPRPPIPEGTVAEVVYTSDRACCICRKPNSYRDIHHIDEDRTNNDPANLAVVCKECHTDIHTRRDFARKLTPATVTKYRDEWLKLVQEKRRVQAGHPAPAQRLMTTEQARRHARRLRDLYEPFYGAVLVMKDTAHELSQPWESETWDARERRLAPQYNDASQMVNSTLLTLRVEPGSMEVCKQYDLFYLYLSRYIGALKSRYDYASVTFNDPDHSVGFWRRLGWGTDNWRDSMNERVRGLQEAIQKHIESMDTLT